MEKIHMTIDDGLILEHDRQDLINLVEKSGVEYSYELCDTSAKGGISWFPTDLIILIAKGTLTGVAAAFGKELYQKLKVILKRIISSKKRSQAISIYFSFEINSRVTAYFTVDSLILNDIDEALDNLSENYDNIYSEINRFLDEDFKMLTGEFRSIKFAYDPIDHQWIIDCFGK